MGYGILDAGFYILDSSPCYLLLASCYNLLNSHPPPQKSYYPISPSWRTRSLKRILFAHVGTITNLF